MKHYAIVFLKYSALLYKDDEHGVFKEAYFTLKDGTKVHEVIDTLEMVFNKEYTKPDFRLNTKEYSCINPRKYLDSDNLDYYKHFTFNEPLEFYMFTANKIVSLIDLINDRDYILYAITVDDHDLAKKKDLDKTYEEFNKRYKDKNIILKGIFDAYSMQLLMLYDDITKTKTCPPIVECNENLITYIVFKSHTFDMPALNEEYNSSMMDLIHRYFKISLSFDEDTSLAFLRLIKVHIANLDIGDDNFIFIDRLFILSKEFVDEFLKIDLEINMELFSKAHKLIYFGRKNYLISYYEKMLKSKNFKFESGENYMDEIINMARITANFFNDKNVIKTFNMNFSIYNGGYEHYISYNFAKAKVHITPYKNALTKMLKIHDSLVTKINK